MNSELVPVEAPTVVYSMPHLGGLLFDDELVKLGRLWDQWTSKRAKNALLGEYRNGHRTFKDLGISIPPQMVRTRAAVDWPARAVDARTRMMHFEGFMSNDGREDPFSVQQLLLENNFYVELPMVFESAFTHCTAFMSTTMGDTLAGEPEVVIQGRDAQWATALWDQRRRCISAALMITEVDPQDNVTGFILFTVDNVLILTRELWGKWVVDRRPNRLGRVPVEQFPFKPTLSSPFGRSAITRESRYLTDAAIRTMVRAETSAEFFSSPQRYVLGASESAFENKGRWEAITGRLWALSVNEEGDMPTVGQFPQLSMQPHLEMYRQLANSFCAANNLPPSSLGIYSDNPSSAEAMQASQWALADDQERQWVIWEPSLRRLYQNVVMIRDRLSSVSSGLWDITAKHAPCRYQSVAASSDYIVKVAGAIPEVAQTTVGLRRAGFSVDEIAQMRAELSRVQAMSVLDRLANGSDDAGDAGKSVKSGGAASGGLGAWV